MIPRDAGSARFLTRLGQPGPRRRGNILMAVLVCLAVGAVIMVSTLRGAIVEQRQLQMQLRRLQCARLAEAGLERAAAQLAQASDYTGETWHVAPEELGGTAAATVTISVVPIPDQTRRWRVSSQADYPSDSKNRIHKSRETVVALP